MFTRLFRPELEHILSAFHTAHDRLSAFLERTKGEIAKTEDAIEGLAHYQKTLEQKLVDGVAALEQVGKLIGK